ncbi:MAG: hypothetical protein WDM76_09800 [Limisphaerales bacterium]
MNSPVIVFDLGKVLLDFDYAIAIEKNRGAQQPAAREFSQPSRSSPLLVQYETGLMTRHDFFEEVRKSTGFRGDLAEFGEFFAGIFAPIEPMIALHAELRQRGLKTFIFSNTNDLAIDLIRRDFPFFKKF